MAGSKEQKGDTQEAKGLQILVLEIHSLSQGTLGRPYTVLRPDVSPFPAAAVLPQSGFSSFLLQEVAAERREPGRQRPTARLSGCPSPALTTELMRKWLLIKSLRKKETIFHLNAHRSSRVG